MSTSSPKQDDSDDEFESADEGEPISPSTTKPPTPPPPPSPPPSDPILPPLIENQVQSTPLPPAVTDGWGDWNIDDEQLIETPIKISNPSQQDSTSSRSSSPSKTGGSLSQIGSDEDDQSESSNQERLQRKKYRKKQIESNLNKDENKINTRISRPTERRDEETLLSSSSSTTTKHDVKDAHNVLDRLAAQSPTRTVYLIIIFFIQRNKILFFCFSQLGIIHGVILDHFYPQLNKVFQH
jgi:hypothetical protein